MCSWFSEDLSTPISFKPIKDYSLDNLLYIWAFLCLQKNLMKGPCFDRESIHSQFHTNNRSNKAAELRYTFQEHFPI